MRRAGSTTLEGILPFQYLKRVSGGDRNAHYLGKHLLTRSASHQLYISIILTYNALIIITSTHLPLRTYVFRYRPGAFAFQSYSFGDGAEGSWLATTLCTHCKSFRWAREHGAGWLKEGRALTWWEGSQPEKKFEYSRAELWSMSTIARYRARIITLQCVSGNRRAVCTWACTETREGFQGLVFELSCSMLLLVDTTNTLWLSTES